jgi:site-specific recombinase XerD
MANLPLKYVNEYTDRHGRKRRYFRRKGGKNLPLHGLPGSAEFNSAYEAYLGNQPAPVKRQLDGSFGKLVDEYLDSAWFKQKLKKSSQRNYRSILVKLQAEHGHRAVAAITTDAVERIIDRIGADTPAMANLTKAVLRRLMTFAVKRKHVQFNPAAGMESFDMGEHWCWTELELAQFEQRWPLGTRQRLAYEVLLCTTQRISDAAEMNRTKITVENGQKYIHLVQIKTGVELSLPLLPELEAAMKAYPTKGLALIGSKRTGEPITVGSVSLLMSDAIDKAGLPVRCVPHGLRKASMRRMAEMGFSTHQIAAWSGHKTLREIEHYTKAAAQKKLAMAGAGIMAAARILNKGS